METLILKIIDNDQNKIEKIQFLTNSNVFFEKPYKQFAYNIDFYKGNRKVDTQKINVTVKTIANNKIQIEFSGFSDNGYSKAIITSLSAYSSDSDELLVLLEPEITYTFSN